MTDTTTAPGAEPTDTVEAVRPAETPEQTIAALREALAKANSEAKDNRLKAAELDKLKVAQMSDLERTQAELAASRTEAESAKAEALRWRIAAANGISDEDAETFLTGADEATLTRQAARLREFAAAQGGEPEVRRTPRADASQGPKDHSAAQVVAKPGLSRLTAGITDALETMN